MNQENQPQPPLTPDFLKKILILCGKSPTLNVLIYVQTLIHIKQMLADLGLMGDKFNLVNLPWELGKPDVKILETIISAGGNAHNVLMSAIFSLQELGQISNYNILPLIPGIDDLIELLPQPVRNHIANY